MSAYRQTALLNGEGQTDNLPETYTPLLAALDAFPNEWLLRVEMLEVANEELLARLDNELFAIGQRDEKLLPLVTMALESL